MGTNILQIMTPVLALTLLFVIGLVGTEDVKSMFETTIYITVPQVFGMNYKPIANLLLDYINVDNCDKWFYAKFSPNASDETKEYFGKNKGTPWISEDDRGMINSNNILTQSCGDINKTVPYFKSWEEDN